MSYRRTFFFSYNKKCRLCILFPKGVKVNPSVYSGEKLREK